MCYDFKKTNIYRDRGKEGLRKQPQILFMESEEQAKTHVNKQQSQTEKKKD